MGNAFVSQPELDSPFPRVREAWTCPITGIVVPKDPSKNLEWRAHLLSLADKDEQLQAELVAACRLSPLFFANAFCMTLRVFVTDQEGEVQQADHTDVPYVTWEVQDEHILAIEGAIDGGYSLGTDKSRDMGATWNHILVMCRRFLFLHGQNILVLSRKEDCVDLFSKSGISDPGTLLGKCDYIFKWLPEWMRPQMERKKMHILNVENGNRIDGESANAEAGSSDRRTFIFLDEMAKMSEGESIKRSTKDVTACRLPCSTPNGPGTAFSEWVNDGVLKVFRLPWWEHPEKGFGRYVEQDDSSGKWKIRSPWYNREEQERSPRELAIEVDMDHIGSGTTFFEAHTIERHRRLFARPPRGSRRIDLKKTIPISQVPNFIARKDRSCLQIIPHGPLRLWVGLIDGRLDQAYNYTLGIDTSKGQGASNSVISIYCNENHEKVAEWADPNTTPYDFARIIVAISLWVGGATHGLPVLCWESDGPGWYLGKELVRTYRYPHYYVDRTEGKIAEKRGSSYGWKSTRQKKTIMLEGYSAALTHGKYINHSAESMTEALTYISYDGGGVGPAALISDSTGARSAHGDRVIADALCLIGCGDVKPKAPKAPSAPHRSAGWRREQALARRKAAAQKMSYDWSSQ